MKRTTVISVRGRKRAELEADPDFVYVGRAVPRQGWTRSLFANPYRVHVRAAPSRIMGDAFRTAEEAVMRYEGELRNALEVIAHPDWRRSGAHWEKVALGLPRLRGKVLGCWCCDWHPAMGEPPKPCHAVVLARLADAIEVA